MTKQICKKCGEHRKRLNEDGICVFCLHGYGGEAIEKKSNQEYGIGKALKSAVID